MTTIAELIATTVQSDVTVEDIHALHELPIETIVADCDGDVFVKTGLNTYACKVLDLDWSAGQLSQSLPGVIQNPELLDRRPVSLGGFGLGDRVETTTSDSVGFPVGTVGTVTEIGVFLRVEADNLSLNDGHSLLLTPSELTHYVPAPVVEAEAPSRVDDSELVGAFLNTTEGLDALGDGAVIVSVDTRTVRYRQEGAWRCVAADSSQSWNTSTDRIARSQGFTVVKAA